MRQISILYLFGMLTFAFGLMFAHQASAQHYEWTYRLTVTIETPDGDRTGSSVRKADASFYNLFHIGNEMKGREYGEATFVQVDDDSVLFVLANQGVFWTGGLVEDFPSGNKPMLEALQRFSRRNHGVRLPLPPQDLPRMAFLRNTADPSSFEEVTAETFQDVLGSEYRLKSAFIEFVGAPVTTGKIQEILGPDFFTRASELRRQSFDLFISDVDNEQSNYFRSFAAKVNEDRLIGPVENDH